MAEVFRLVGALVESDLDYGRKSLKVVDVDTGEIMLEKQTGDIDYVFAAGANAVQKELMVGREVNEQGMEHITISDYDTPDGRPKVILSGWRNPHKQKKNETPKHTGGKPSYVKLFSSKVLENAQLKDAELGFLMRLSGYVEWATGVLVDRRTKKPISMDGIATALGVSRETAIRRIAALQDAGALAVTEDGSYVLSRDFIQKG